MVTPAACRLPTGHVVSWASSVDVPLSHDRQPALTRFRGTQDVRLNPLFPRFTVDPVLVCKLPEFVPLLLVAGDSGSATTQSGFHRLSPEMPSHDPDPGYPSHCRSVTVWHPTDSVLWVTRDQTFGFRRRPCSAKSELDAKSVRRVS
jgi:hypothetical protein